MKPKKTCTMQLTNMWHPAFSEIEVKLFMNNFIYENYSH